MTDGNEREMKKEPLEQANSDGKGELQEVVEERIAEQIEAIPQDEPVSSPITEDVLNEKLTAMEERLASKFVQMGGIINTISGKEEIEPEEPKYVPLSEMDFRI